MIRIQMAMVGAVLVSACATNTVAAQVRMPPASPAAAQLRTISVLPFAGRDGEIFASLARAELQSAALDGTLYFSVVSDDALSSAIGVYNSANNRQQAISALVRVGRDVGVSAIYTGTSEGASINRNSTRENKKRCVEYEGLFNCKREEEYVTTCHNVQLTYRATPEVIDIQTGNIVYSQALFSTQEERYCEDDGRKGSDDVLLSDARRDVAQQLRRAVAPYNSTVQVAFRSEANDLPAAQQPAFGNAVKFAQAGQMDRACADWSALAPDGQSPSINLLYNLAVCKEITGDYAGALMIFSQAESRLSEPDRALREARERTQRAMQSDALVNELVQ